MAYVGGDDFDLDDDGILRDSVNGTDLIIDDDGILRDDDELDTDLDPYKHVTRGHWTDSGIGGDKQSSTSTLRQMQNSFEEDLPPIGDESINISEFEASKDDLSFDRVEDGPGGGNKWAQGQRSSLDLADTLGSTLDKPDPQTPNNTNQAVKIHSGQAEDEGDHQLFTEDYYRQLRDLGVLVDGADLSKDSLDEFEELESRVASRMEGEEDKMAEEEERGTQDLIGEYLASEYQREKEEEEQELQEIQEADKKRSRATDESKNQGGVNDVQEREGRAGENFSRASSARTISSRSFPGDEDFEVERSRKRRGEFYDDYDYGSDDEKENVNLSQNLGSQGGSQSQRMTGEDDKEIYSITSRILPASPGQGSSGHSARGRAGFRGQSPARGRSGSQGQSPARSGRHHSSNSMAYDDSRDFDEDDARSVHSEAYHNRPGSSASHVSTASELVSRRQKKAEEAALNRLASARSQESFFSHDSQHGGDRSTPRTPTTPHKRLLPRPNSSSNIESGPDFQHNRSFKVKNKGGGVSASGPLRPTHGGSMSNIDAASSRHTPTQLRQRPNSDLGGSADAHDDAGHALSERLSQEAQKRKQATELVQQLQRDYDNLLTKYALAELTIDQMRLDGRVTITSNTDSPTPGQAASGVMSPSMMGAGQAAHRQPSPAQQAVLVRSSPAVMGAIGGAGVIGRGSPYIDGATTDNVDGRPPAVPGDQKSRSRGVGTGSEATGRPSSTSSLTPAESEDGVKEIPESAASVKGELMTQARALDERLESFWSHMNQGQLTLEQQEHMFDQIKGDHDKLRRTYLQAKDDYNVLRRSGVMDKDAINFDQNKELEGQLFRLGMRFDEVHETVESNLKERPAQRQPFQTDSNNNNTNNNRTEDNRTRDSGSVGRAPSRTNSLDPVEEAAFEQHMSDLRQDYNDNMDAYRKLKYQEESSPEAEAEMEVVVKRLNEICTEMPDMFRLSPEIQSRCDKMKQDGKLSFIERKNSVWEKLNRREQEAKSQRRSPVPASPRNRGVPQSPVDGRPPSILRRTSSDASDVDSLRARLDGSRSSLGSILPDRMERPPSRGQAPTSTQDRPSSRASNRSNRRGSGGGMYDQDRPSSRSEMKQDSSFTDRSPRNNPSPTPSLPRPRRHAHELKDPKLSKMPDMSLPKSSHHDAGADRTNGRQRGSSPLGSAGGATGGVDAHEALAALPGPGRFKQMTKQRAADDADSGFLGSMVGSGVGHPSLAQASSQQALGEEEAASEEDKQRERTLRLRQRQDESSTITDNSMDTSSQPLARPSGRRRGSSEAASGQDNSRRGQRRRVEESYDAEEDTMETVNTSQASGSGIKRRNPRHGSSHELSLDATLEEDESVESDHSTPRAPRPGATPPPAVKRRDSDQQVSNQETDAMVRPRRPSSRGQTASETEEELRAINNSKIRNQDARQRETGGRPKDKETVHRTRLKSPPPPGRPSSRGSPTTDLYHTRARHASGESRRSSASSRRGETTRGEKQEIGHQRAELRKTQQGPKMDRPSSRQGQQHFEQHHHQEQQQQKQSSSEVASSLPPGLAPASDLARRVKDYEERSVASSDVEVGSSVTRASSVNSSNRLKALQEEIEKLKEGVARANEKASRPPPQYPPQAPPIYVHSQTQQTPPSEAPSAAAAPSDQKPEQPEYYDPFDDPYGFMRMPRRRANSFSGGREREWDEWYWTLPQNRQYDGGDIPLGYAAADAYAENPPQRRGEGGARERNARETVKERMRQRRQERQQREEGQMEIGADGRQTTSPKATGGANDPQTQAVYDYYIPSSRYSAQGMRNQLASRGFFTTPTGAKIYSSTGEDADVEGENHEGEPGGLTQQHWFGPQQGPQGVASRPWYQIRRAGRPFASQQYGTPMAGQLYNTGGRMVQSQEDVRSRPQFYGGYGTQVSSATCPMCGNTGTHSHANYTHFGHSGSGSIPHQTQMSSARSFTRNASPPRRRSRSAGRSHSNSHYKVREYTSFSDSDEDHRRPSRSRSVSRGRSGQRSRSRHRNSRRYSSDSDQSFDDHGLDRSLSLSQDISRITKKMLGTLRGELRKTRSRSREFGSSYW